MTESKILKQLKSLVEKVGNDFIITEIYDAWGFNYESKKADDILKDWVLLEDVVKEFEAKSGKYYEVFKVTATFRDFEKYVLNGTFKPYKIYQEYEGTKTKYMEYFKETHPGVDYKEWAAEQKRLRKERLVKQYMQFATVLSPYTEIAKKLFAF